MANLVVKIGIGLALLSSSAFACSVADPSAMGCSAEQEFSTFSCQCEPKAGRVLDNTDNDSNNEHTIASNPPAEYLSCQQDSDCTLEEGICGEAMAVNTSHAQAYREASVKANSVIRCIRAADPLTNFSAACEDGHCSRSPMVQ